jgi:hypothetical protein
MGIVCSKTVGRKGDVVWLYFACLRARRWHAQVTHVFALCDEPEAPPSDSEFILEFANASGCFTFLSVWEVARKFSATPCCGLSVEVHAGAEQLEKCLYRWVRGWDLIPAGPHLYL